ncbi:MAG: hypothetical protein ACJ763_19500 [Bdellovibrionia bacterium]
MNIVNKWVLRSAVVIMKNRLETWTPDYLLQKSSAKALKMFKTAAAHFPAYQDILKAKGVTAESVRTIDDFYKRVPLIDKQSVFGKYKLEDLVTPETAQGLSDYFVSSGTSGTFSFGLKTKKELKNIRWWTDANLERYFGITRKRTLIVNCLPMASRVYSDLPKAELGAHAERALAVIQSSRAMFDQFLIVSLGHIFFKKLIELGEAQGIRWDEMPVYFLTGGETLPENARQYFLSRLPKSQSGGSPRVASSGGLTELSMNAVFFETPETIAIRQEAMKNTELRKALYGEDVITCPPLFCWNPLSTFLEIEAGKEMGEIIATNLDSDCVTPLVRYNLHEKGKIFNRVELSKIFERFQLGHLQPKMPLPIIAFYGRADEMSRAIQDFIYVRHDIARALTANFKAYKDPDGKLKRVMFQLKKDQSPKSAFFDPLVQDLERQFGAGLSIEFIEFQAFPYGMDLNFENKFDRAIESLNC